MKVTALSTTQAFDGADATVNATVVDASGVTHNYTFMSSHPSYKAVLSAVRGLEDGALTNQELAEKLLTYGQSPVERVREKLVQVHAILDGRMHVAGNTVTIDHEPIDPCLEGFIIRLLGEDGQPKDEARWRGFAKFVENLYSNMSEHVRLQLFGWLNAETMTGRGFTLTEDGCFIGYKGLAGTMEDPVSIHSGPAIVDGVAVNGHVPNKPGSLIEMARGQVEHNPAVGCASGLHVGTYSYAEGFAQGVIASVKVNPRDVVSVPTECNAQKIRACRYTVLELVEAKNEGTFYASASPTGSTASAASLSEGDEAVITYRNRAGEEKVYEGTVTKNDGYYIDFELAEGGYRTFVISNILSVTVDGEDEEETCGECGCCCSCEDDCYCGCYCGVDEDEDEDEEEDDEGVQASTPDYSSVKPGVNLVVTYSSTSGQEKTYAGVVERVVNGVVTLRLESGDYRSLSFGRFVEFVIAD